MKPLSFEKYIRDPLHGLIGLLPHEKAVVDLPIYQRLRWISQLGFARYVYPSATHSRFEHSVGVMQVITDYYESILKSEITDIDVRNMLLNDLNDEGERFLLPLRLAALLHDIGHPPFSHGLEAVLPHKHEEYTFAIIEKSSIRDTLLEFGFSKKLLDMIKSILTGKLGKDLMYLGSMINSSIDADRMDYLLRDSYHCGVKYGVYDYPRLLRGVAVKNFHRDGREVLDIVFNSKVFEEVENFLLARYRMFIQVYLHKTYIGFLNALWRVFEWLKENEDNLGILIYPQPSDPNLEELLIERDEVWLLSLLRDVKSSLRKNTLNFSFDSVSKEVLLDLIDSILYRKRIKLFKEVAWAEVYGEERSFDVDKSLRELYSRGIPRDAIMVDDKSFIIYQTFKPEYRVYLFDETKQSFYRIDQVERSIIHNIAKKKIRYVRIYILEKYFNRIFG